MPPKTPQKEPKEKAPKKLVSPKEKRIKEDTSDEEEKKPTKKSKPAAASTSAAPSTSAPSTSAPKAPAKPEIAPQIVNLRQAASTVAVTEGAIPPFCFYDGPDRVVYLWRVIPGSLMQFSFETGKMKAELTIPQLRADEVGELGQIGCGAEEIQNLEFQPVRATWTINLPTQTAAPSAKIMTNTLVGMIINLKNKY